MTRSWWCGGTSSQSRADKGFPSHYPPSYICFCHSQGRVPEGVQCKSVELNAGFPYSLSLQLPHSLIHLLTHSLALSLSHYMTHITSLQGTKWTATKWIHNRPYGTGFDPLKLAAECKDTAHNCK